MLCYIYGSDLDQFPRLATEMFQDRADQFRTRLGWDVVVDASGAERDVYDSMNPLYVIWENPDGGHGGSMRFLPTTGPVMVNDHFGHLTTGPIKSPHIWECTRFCLARGASPHVAAALMLGGGEIMRNFDVRHFAGVFDARMVRIYRMIGAPPEILGSEGEGRAKIAVGLWGYSDAVQVRVAAKAGITPVQSQHWFDAFFGQKHQEGERRKTG